MSLEPRFDKIPESICSEPTFSACRYVLPVGVITTLLAAAAIFILYDDVDRTYNLIAPLVLATWFFILWRFALPQIRSLKHLDMTIVALLAPVVLHFGILSFCRGDSENAAGVISLVLFSAILFRSTWVYYLFAAISLSTWLVTNRMGTTEPFDARVMMYVYVMAPIMIFVLRNGWMFSLNAVLESRRREQQMTRQLSRTVDNLEQEKTLRQQSENQLLHAQKMESIGLLAGGIAHDFNNFLMAISALAETLEHASEEPIVLRSAYEIKDIAKTAATVCQQMLTYSGRSFESYRPLRASKIIYDMNSLLRASIPRNVDLIIEPSNEADLMILADAPQIQQAILNLVTNSGQAISKQQLLQGDGKVRISIAKIEGNDLSTRPSWAMFGNQIDPTKDYAAIVVRDNGDGVDSNELPKIFDPYFTKKESGHGLGLSVTLGIAVSHGGAIRCQSRRELGTTVEILLPITEVPEEKHVAENKFDSEGIRGNILVVDDEPLILSSLEQLLRAVGWNVKTVSSGNEALDLLDSDDDFDIILLDYSMPGLNGLQTLAEIRDRDILIPIILCSGFMMPEDQLNHVQPDAFIQKPYQLPELQEKLKQLCGGTSETAQLA